MAKAADEAELWLSNEESNKNGINNELDAELSFPSEFPYECDSFGFEPLSSPVESVAGSTETESSDEDDLLAGLTRRLSQASIHETWRQQLTVPISNNDRKAELGFLESQKKARILAGSPQSTLSGIGSWSGRSAGSDDGSPNGSSRVASPPTTPFNAANDAWEVIYAAAGQVARLKMNDDVSRFDFQNRGLLGGLPRATPPLIAAENPATALFANQNLAHVQYQRLRQEQVMKQQCGSGWGRPGTKGNCFTQQLQQQQRVQNRGREFGYECSVKCVRPLPQSAWPLLQVKHQNQQLQHGGSGLRAGLHGGSGVKRGCAGTGVFLPRQYGAPPEPRKKTNCAPVVRPAKAIQALNMNIDDLNATTQQRFSSPFGAEYDALLARRNVLLMQQKLNMLREEAANYEIRLPQDWPY